MTTEVMTAQSDDTISFALGDQHLTLEADHYLSDDQESVLVTVKNEGAVTSQPATLVFEQSEDGDDLQRVDVPALAENEEFTYEYKAPEGYFQNSGIEDMTIMLEDPNDPDDAYSLYNSDLVHTWDKADDTATPTASTVSASASNTRTVPKTGDAQSTAQMLFMLFALVATSVAVTARIIRKFHER